MSDDFERIKEELEEVRRLKEKLKDEVEEVRREREHLASRRKTFGHQRFEQDLPEPPEPPPPPAAPIDLGGLTESLEDMMEGIGEQIGESLRHLDGLEAKMYLPRMKFRTKSRRRRTIESIPPERIASAISPLGSEERLRILDFLKDGGRTFNEIETHTGRTGGSLTHHLDPLLKAGYVVKGEVRGKYYVTVEGRLAYRLSQWLTSRLEKEREHNGRTGKESSEGPEVTVDFEDEGPETSSGEDVPDDTDLFREGSDRGEEQ